LLFIHFGSRGDKVCGVGGLYYVERERERWLLVVRMTKYSFLFLFFFLLFFVVVLSVFCGADFPPLFLRPLIGINNAFLAWMSDEMDCPSCCTPHNVREGGESGRKNTTKHQQANSQQT
jgi:hypothetical protein